MNIHVCKYLHDTHAYHTERRNCNLRTGNIIRCRSNAGEVTYDVSLLSDNIKHPHYMKVRAFWDTELRSLAID
jgi:hypothetical protein